MGRYDEIYGAGNVTVEAPPDFWTAAKQSFDDDYDRLVEAEQRKDIKKQQALENDRSERTLIMQEEQAATQQEAADRQKFMNELSMFTDPSQRAMWAKRTGVSRGWVSREQVEEWEEQGVAHESYESLRTRFLSGDAATRSLISGPLREAALASRAPAAEIKLWDEWGAEADEKVGMKQALELAFTGMPKDVRESMESIINTDYINEKTIDVIEAKLKQSTEYASDVYQGKVDLLKNVRTSISNFDEMTPQSVRNRFQLIDLQLSADLAAGRVEEEDVKAMEYPTLEEYDERIAGKKGSFDLATDVRKGKIFNEAVSETIGIEEWKKLSPEEQRKTADKIIADINKTSYEVLPEKVVQAGFGPVTGVEYDVPFIERASMEGITEKMITSKVNSLMKKIPEGQRTDKMKSKVKERAIELLKDERTKQYKQKLKKLSKEEKRLKRERITSERLYSGYQPYRGY